MAESSPLKAGKRERQIVKSPDRQAARAVRNLFLLTIAWGIAVVAASPDVVVNGEEPRSPTPRLESVEYVTDQVNAVAISSDGKRVAGGGMDKSVRIWDLQSGNLLHRIEGFERPVRTVAFQPGASLVAAGGSDLAVRICDASNGAVRRVLRSALPTVQSVAFSPNGRWLAGCTYRQTEPGRWEGYLLVWDVETGNLLRKVAAQTNGGYRGVSFSPDGHWLAAAFDEIKMKGAASGVQLWDTTNWTLKSTLLRDRGLSVSVAFSPDGRRIASGGGYVLVKDGRVATGEIKIWDVAAGNLTNTLARPAEGGYLAVAFSPDGTTIAAQGFGPVVSEGNTTRVISETTLWSAETERRIWTRRLPFCGEASSPAFTPDGKKLIVCDVEAVRVLDASSGETLRELMKVTETPLRGQQSKAKAN